MAQSRKKSPAPGKSKGKKRRPQFTPRQWLALVLVGLLALALLGALLVAMPSLKDELFWALGITPKAQVPALAEGAQFSPVSVHFIDVGQGDAALIEADGEFALIDAGPPEGEEHLLAYLRAAGVERLRYVFMTHPHTDHMGGMNQVVARFDVELLVLPDFAKGPYPTHSLFLALLETAAQKQLATQTAAEGAVYPLGSGSITVLQDGLATDDNLNLISLITLFQAGELRFLNTGDAESQNERALLQSGADLRADLYSAGHHGSSTSNTAAFVQAVRPRLVVVQSAPDNSYGHPHRAPMDRFEQAGARVLNTAANGDVRAGLDTEGNFAYAVSRTQTPENQMAA